MRSIAVKVIVFASTKGGTGKSTLCFNAGMHAAREHQVLFADLDPQGSLTELWQRRAELLNPQIVKHVNGVASAVRRLEDTGYSRDYLFIDTPGSHVPIIRDAVAVSLLAPALSAQHGHRSVLPLMPAQVRGLFADALEQAGQPRRGRGRPGRRHGQRGHCTPSRAPATIRQAARATTEAAQAMVRAKTQVAFRSVPVPRPCATATGQQA